MTDNKDIKRNYELSHLVSSDKKDDGYCNAMADKYIREFTISATRRTEIQALYDLAQGVRDNNATKYVTNPLNTENANYTRFPAKLRNYDIIRPILDVFLGETTKREYGATVTVANPDAQDKKKAAKSEAMAAQVAQDFVNQLNGMGVQTGVPSQDIPSYQESGADFEENYDDQRAIFGQEALDYIKQNVSLDMKILQLMYDWCCVGCMYTFKEPRHDDVIYNVEDPRDIVVIGWGESRLAEDAEAVVKAVHITGSELLSKFFEEIQVHEKKDEILEYINHKMIEDTTLGTFVDLHTTSLDSRTEQGRPDWKKDEVSGTLYHVVWNTITKVRILHYYNEFGQRTQMYVDSTYKLDEAAGDIELEDLIIREWYENYRIEDKFYIGGGRGAAQRHLINNLGSCKLPYNGTFYGFRQTEITSKVKQLATYQELFDIFHYRWELLLAKNKEKILMMPLGMIPAGVKGWDEDKVFYFMEAMGMLLYDETAPNAQLFIQGLKAIDLSTGNAAEKMYNNLMAIKQEAWDVVGHNRQRAGETFASDGKATNEQAIIRSSIITAAMNFQFDKFMECEYKGLLDISKIAFIDGKKASYINSEGKKAFFAIEGQDILDFVESDFNIIAKNTVFEQEKLNKAEQLILTMGQNGLPPDSMLEVLDHRNFSSLKRLVKKGMAAEKAFQKSLKQMEQQTAQIMTDGAKAVQDSKNQTDITVAKIQARAKVDAAQSTKDVMNVLEEDTMELESSVDVMGVSNNLAKQEEANRKRNQNAETTQLKREQMASQERVAKENKNKYDK